MEENERKESVSEARKGSKKASMGNKRIVFVEDFMRSQVFFIFFFF